MRRRLMLALGIVIVTAAATSIALGAVGAGGVIKTCFSTQNIDGWHPIDNSKSCKSTETALDFYSKAGADAIFQTQSGAASTYLTKADAASNYLTQTDAASTYLGKTEKAADSDKLDGIDSSGFVKGTGIHRGFTLTCTLPLGSAGTPCTLPSGQDGVGTLLLECGNPGSGDESLVGLRSGGTETRFDLIFDTGTTVSRLHMPPGSSAQVAASTGDFQHYSFETLSDAGVVGVWDIYVDRVACTASGMLDVGTS